MSVTIVSRSVDRRAIVWSLRRGSLISSPDGLSLTTKSGKSATSCAKNEGPTTNVFEACKGKAVAHRVKEEAAAANRAECRRVSGEE